MALVAFLGTYDTSRLDSKHQQASKSIRFLRSCDTSRLDNKCQQAGKTMKCKQAFGMSKDRPRFQSDLIQAVCNTDVHEGVSMKSHARHTSKQHFKAEAAQSLLPNKQHSD